MKCNRRIGLLGFLMAMVVVSYGQNIINLDIRISENTAESSDAILKKLHLTNPLIIKLSDLNARIEKVIGYYENTGFPFVQIRLDSVKEAPDGIFGLLSIQPGELVIIDTILNRTGFRISSPVLYRLMNIRPGDPYRESAVKEASGRLNMNTYLRQARPLEVGFHKGNASVYVYPEKANANRFDGWVGLSPDLRAAGKLAFSGALTFNLSNILGQGENWKFNWNRNQDNSQKLNLAAHVPYLAGLPFGLKGSFELYRQDTSYLNLGWDAGVPYHFGPGHLLNLFIRHRESSILAKENGVGNPARQPFSSLLSGLTWEFSNLNNPINPFRGLEFRLEASTGRKIIPDSTSMPQSEFAASISWFQPLARSLALALILQSGYRKSPETYENEQYRLGGLALLRGFDEDVFHTDAFAVTSIELRYLLDQSSHLIVLSDVGFLRVTDTGIPVLKIPVGLGLGGQIRTGGGIFRIIFALGKDGALPLNMKNSKIHLGYVGIF